MATGAFLYFGGKQLLAPKLLQHFPAEAKCYVEPFFGGGGMFFGVPKGLYDIEVVNDINRSVVTFFKVLRDREEELVRACKLTPYAQDEHTACADPTEDPPDELETARRLWVRQTQSYCGIQQNASWHRGTHYRSFAQNTDNAIKDLYELADRLRRVEICNGDAVELVERYSHPGVFLYLDPPYLQETRGDTGSYQYEMSVEGHRKLAKAACAARDAGAMVAVSGYAHPLYDELYPGWRVAEIEAWTAIAASEDNKRTELLWLSYPKGLEIGEKSPKVRLRPGNKREAAVARALKRKGFIR